MKRVPLKRPDYGDSNWHGWPPQTWDGKKWVYQKGDHNDKPKDGRRSVVHTQKALQSRAITSNSKGPRKGPRQRLLPREYRKPLEAGGRIRLRYNPSWTGKITHLGLEVSQVRFDEGGLFRYIPNEHLEAM